MKSSDSKKPAPRSKAELIRLAIDAVRESGQVEARPVLAYMREHFAKEFKPFQEQWADRGAISEIEGQIKTRFETTADSDGEQLDFSS